MFNLFLGNKSQPLRKILCLGAHCDDIEIGCGGTILQLVRAYPGLEVDWIVFSSTSIRKREAAKAAQLFLKDCDNSRVRIHSFRDSYFPTERKKIKDMVQEIKGQTSPDLIFTHFRHDLHQDHRIINELTWNAFREHLILEYEIPKYDGDLGSPNLFVPIDEPTCRVKVKNILAAFASQASKSWFTEDMFRALMRIRGIESGGQARFAEAFYCRKTCIM